MQILDAKSDKTAVSVEGYSLSFDGAALLENIHCSAKFENITTLIGPNGAGKSSLMKAIAGDFFRYESKGKIELCHGLGLSDMSLSDRAQHVAVLPQKSELQFPFTVKEVVELGRIPHGDDEKNNGEIVTETMARLKVDHLAKKQYTRLSGGEKQRVQLSRVFAQIWDDCFSSYECTTDNATVSRLPQKILLLDEPTASLDLNYQDCFSDAIKYLSSCGVAIIVVSHDINLSLKYTDSFIAMKKGRVIAEGGKNIISAELMSDLFDVSVSVISHPSGGKLVAF
ncbi:MAG: ATP-binding cassette domain-containing protein [Cellvibrionaceae bacterium]